MRVSLRLRLIPATWVRGAELSDNSAGIPTYTPSGLISANESHMNTPQRPFWSGRAERLRELFTLTKPSGARASCELHSHIFGFEIKLIVNDGLVRSKVLRDPEQIQAIADEWRSAMLKDGWQ